MARVKVLVKGFIDIPNKGPCSGWSTNVLISDGKHKIIVDPGTVKNQDIIHKALKNERLTVRDISHVFITHSHLDHYRNLGMFPNAIAVDIWGKWKKEKLFFNSWSENPKFSVGNFSKDIHIIKTPGHDESCLTFFVRGHIKFKGRLLKGIIGICGDVFWKKDFPKLKEEPFAVDKNMLGRSRKLVLENSDYIIPGHDDVYKVN